MAKSETSLYRLMLVNIFAVALLAVIRDGFASSFGQFLAVQQHPARLINDYTGACGISGTLLNVAAMGLLALAMVWFTGVRLSGPTMAAILTIMGFSFFGKTPVNATPVVLGVYLSARLSGRPFQNVLLIALFGTALGPIVTYLVHEAGFSGPYGLPLGLGAGVATGLGLPPLALAMLKLHQGFNLYNIGFTCGFAGLFAASILEASNCDISINVVWNSTSSLVLTWFVPAMSVLYIVWGALMDGRNLGANLKAIMKLPGRLPSDFVDMVTPGASLVNAGILGLAGSLYLGAVGADFNGPTLGGLLTVMGFALFGKHARNCWPVAVGVIVSTLVFGKSLSAPGPVLALLFGTTLAPLAGEYGILVGVAAGFTHLLMVERSAAWHGGLDLYNNGFAGGLTATLFVSVIEWINSSRGE